MKKFILLFLIFILGTPLSLSNTDSKHKWEKIIPLVSTCEEVKKTLEVKKCSFPKSIYQFPDYIIGIDFSTGNDKWKVKKGTVTGVTIGLFKAIKLDDYVKDLKNYKIIPIKNEMNFYEYINKEKGILLTVSNTPEDKNDLWIESIFIGPPKKKCGNNKVSK